MTNSTAYDIQRQNFTNAVENIRFSSDSERNAIIAFKHDLYYGTSDTNRMIDMLNLMRETNCELHIANADSCDVTKQGGSFIDPLSNRTRTTPKVVIYYDNNFSSSENTMIHEIMGHLKAYQNKCRYGIGHIKNSNFHDFIIENSMEEANAIAIEAEEAHKSQKTWIEFKNLHGKIADRYEKIINTTENKDYIYQEIFKAWYAEKEYQVGYDIPGGKGYSSRFVSEYLKYRYDDDEKVREAGSDTLDKEYPYLAKKDMNNVLRATSSGRLDKEKIDIEKLVSSFQISHKDWMRLNRMSAKNPNTVKRDATFAKFSTYDYNQKDEIKYIYDIYERITEQYSDKSDPELKKKRNEVRYYIRSYDNNKIIPTSNGSLFNAIRTWIIAEKNSRKLHKHQQAAITEIENLIAMTPVRFPNDMQEHISELETKEKNSVKNLTALAIRKKNALIIR